jgi:hypothetical protein
LVGVNDEGRAVDFSRFGPKTIDVLANVAFGGNGTGIARGRLEDLEAKGLIDREMKTSSDRFGSYSWPVWFMPLPVHIQFCAWIAESEPAGEL